MKLDQANVQDIMALTPLQEGILYHYLAQPGSGQYLEQLCLELTGRVDQARFVRAWERVTEANSMLRTLFRWENLSHPVQVILRRHQPQVRVTRLGSGDSQAFVETARRRDRDDPLDLRQPPLRITLLMVSDERAHMLITSHHILFDGWSNGIILREFLVAYHDPDWSPTDKPDFKAFVKFLQKRDASRDQDFWRGYLEGYEYKTLPELADSGPFPPGRVDLTLPGDLSRDLAACARRLRLTPASLIHAAWGLLMQRYLDSRDVVIGSTVAGRDVALSGIENTVGLFINSLPLRVRTNPETTGADLAGAVANDLIALQDHQHTPLLEVRAAAGLKAGSELFESLVAMENYPLDPAGLAGPELAVVGHDFSEQTHYPLSLSYLPHDTPRCVITYRANLLSPEAAQRLGCHFLAILGGLARRPEERVDQIEMLSEPERQQLLVEFNPAAIAWDGPELIQAQFEAQAARRPQRPALLWDGGSLTHAELNRRANHLAWRLKALGLGPDRVAALCLPRSPEMVIAILAVLKAGGAYLPLDPSAPPQRLRLVLEDAQPLCLLSLGLLAEHAAELTPNLPVLDLAREVAGQGDEGNPPFVNHPEDLAYVIYTSGSTGRPKGVMVKQRAAVNLLRVLESRWPVAEGEAWLLKTNYTFDVSVTELFGWFFGQGRLALLTPGGEKDPVAILEAIQRHGVTHLNFAPSMLRAFQEHLELVGTSGLAGLKYLCAAGENLSGDLARRFLALGLPARLLDLYGPTEATVYAAGQDASAEPPDATWIAIGRPLANYRAYVLGGHGGLQPLGVPGELCLGGVGLARGYLNRPETTAEKFVDDPFRPGQLIYRTGDLAYWRPDGNLVCLGRLDHQVKLQGHRLELGEVEEALARHPAIAEAAAVVRGETRGGEGLLCAYYSLLAGVRAQELAPEELRRFLAQNLPHYMIPNHFILLARLPRSAAGKLDRNALPAPEMPPAPEAAPAGETAQGLEARIAAIWREVLGLERLGLNQSFFDLGGHSIALIRVNTRLNKAFGLALTVTELFAHPTIRQQAKLVERAQGKVEPSADPSTPPVARQSAPTAAGPAWASIAVIGLAGRFPGAADVDQLWQNLVAGVESIRFFTPDELRAAGVPEELITDPEYVPAKGWMADSDRFDAAVFAYSETEAARMDPQLRLLHECALHALEQAGYDPWSYIGTIGLYAGASPNPGWLASLPEGAPPSELYAAMTLNERDFLCARVAHRLNLRGPVLTVQTACSTSLVAIHQACRALMNGDCDLALAGGVSLLSPPESGYLHQTGMIRTPDGHCRPFDAEANGTLGGDGVGLVVLKRLDRALAEGDQVLAVIKGGALNNDGADKLGYTAPSIAGQAQVIRRALDLAGVAPESLGYLEAHGTGTPLGDPVEVAALQAAYATDRRGYCALGSLKANLGHLDAAAGVAGLIKAVLLLKHSVIPPSVNFTRPNPKLELAQSPFRVVSVAEPWPARLSPRRAGVSSFGIGGTNAHLVLEEAPPSAEAAPPADGPRLLRLSARTPEALVSLTERLAAHLGEHPKTNLDDLAFTLGQGRRAWEHRMSLVCRELHQARERLAAAPASTSPAREDLTAVLVFPGQGAQHVDMGRGLYETWPAFRRELDQCLDILESLAGERLRAVLYPPDSETSQAAASRIDQTALAQPLLFALEYALARSLLGLGVRPRALIGHSLGEYVAACLAGVFSLEDALGVVLWRGRAMQALPPGGMCALGLARPETESLLTRFGATDLYLAAVNSRQACVVSGPIPAIEAFESFAAGQGAPARRLHTSHAFHSALMEPMLGPFADLLAGIRLRPPAIPYLSNLSGGFITSEQAQSPEYWTAHLRRTVNFSDGVAALLSGGPTVFMELGPGGGLGGRIREQPGLQADQAVVGLLRHPREDVPDLDRLLESLGQLWRLGLSPSGDLPGLNPAGRRIALPGYPLAGKRYPALTAPTRQSAPTAGPVRKQAQVERWLYTPLWRETPAPSGEARQAEPSDCLVLADSRGLAEALAARLERRGQGVILVRRGDDFRALAGGQYQTPPSAAGMAELWSVLAREGRRIGRLVNLRPLDQPEEEVNADSDEPLAGQAFREFLNVLHTLVTAERASELRLCLVGRGLCRVGSEASPRPELALLRGLGLSASQEHPGLSCRVVDLDPATASGWRVGAEVADLATEVLSAATEPLAAWRGGRRWVEDFAPLPIPSASTGDIGPLAIASGGVYLIIGGLGTIGLALADHLARTPGVHLALCGRTALPPHHERPAWLDQHPTDDPVSQRLAGIRDLEALGAEVRTHTVEAGDQAALLDLIRRVAEAFGPIQGIIHAAGERFTNFFRPMEQIDDAYLTREIAPRLRQAQALVALVRECRPAWCLATSSLATVLGGRGLAGYASANHYLEALTAAQEETDTAWLTLAWDGWRPAGQPQAPDSAIAHLLITPEEGRQAFASILAGGRPGRVVISTGDLSQRRREWVTLPLTVTPGSEPTPLPNRTVALAATMVDEDPGQVVARIWREVLGLANLKPGANFFALGGDSLKAITVLSRIKAALGRELPLTEFLARPTLDACLALLAPAGPEGVPSITPAPPAGTYPLSSAQERIYVLQQMDPGDTSHHEAFSLLLEGPLEPVRLRAAASRLVERQPSLRTGIEAGADGPCQRVHPRAELAWQYHAGPEPDQVPDLDQPFDLAQPPLLRLDLTRQAPDRHLLRVVVHHIITDGSSHAIFLRELLTLYAGRELPPLGLQYTDYAVWQQRARCQGWLTKQEAFWRERFASPSRPLELPTDFPRPRVQGFGGQSHHFVFDPELTTALHGLQTAIGATTYTILLGLFAVLLSQYSGQEDFVIGAPVSGRTQPGLEGIIGMFVNLVALRCRPEAERSFKEFLAGLNQDAFAAFANQDYPFEDLVNHLGLQGVLNRNPLCNVVCVLQNLGETKTIEGGLSCRLQEAVEVRTHFDLTLIAVETPQTLDLTLVYSPLLFRPETVAAMVQRLQAIARQATEDPARRLADLGQENRPHGLIAPAVVDEGDFGF